MSSNINFQGNFMTKVWHLTFNLKYYDRSFLYDLVLQSVLYCLSAQNIFSFFLFSLHIFLKKNAHDFLHSQEKKSIKWMGFSTWCIMYFSKSLNSQNFIFIFYSKLYTNVKATNLQSLRRQKGGSKSRRKTNWDHSTLQKKVQAKILRKK